MLSSGGGRVYIGTPFGKSNRLFMQYNERFRLHTIPQKKWEDWDITPADAIITVKKNVDKDICASAHHYPSHVGLSTFKTVSCYPEDVWETVRTKNRRKFKGWIAIKTEDKNIIGQPVFMSEDVQKMKARIGEQTLLYVGEPQISHRNLKIAIRRARVRSVIEREILALFSDTEGVASAITTASPGGNHPAIWLRCDQRTTPRASAVHQAQNLALTFLKIAC